MIAALAMHLGALASVPADANGTTLFSYACDDGRCAERFVDSLGPFVANYCCELLDDENQSFSGKFDSVLSTLLLFGNGNPNCTGPAQVSPSPSVTQRTHAGTPHGEGAGVLCVCARARAFACMCARARAGARARTRSLVLGRGALVCVRGAGELHVVGVLPCDRAPLHLWPHAAQCRLAADRIYQRCAADTTRSAAIVWGLLSVASTVACHVCLAACAVTNLTYGFCPPLHDQKNRAQPFSSTSVLSRMLAWGTGGQRAFGLRKRTLQDLPGHLEADSPALQGRP